MALKWKTIWTFLCYTGVRSGELINLQIKDIDFKNSLIHIKNKPKLGFTIKNYEERSIPINANFITLSNNTSMKNESCQRTMIGYLLRKTTKN